MSVLGQNVEPLALHFSADGKTFFAVDGHGLAAYDVVTGRERRVRGRTIATGTFDQKVRLWSLATRKLERELAGHVGGVSSVAFSRDGTRLASGAGDSTVLVWRLDE